MSEESNIKGICNCLSESLNLPIFGFNTIDDTLNYIFSLDKKIILVLDEYSYLKDTIKGMYSILQSLIDKYKDISKTSLILLGSYVDTMQSLLMNSNPLYGRIDYTINLLPMDYYESSLFYPNYSNENKVRIYSVFGGIPNYNRLINDKLSVKENIINLIASSDARLENEIIYYLNQEISKIVNANEVFDALARGYTRYSDILSQSHVSSCPTLIDVLDKLISMQIVEKTYPINDENNKRKA